METTKGPIYQMMEEEIEEAKECRIFWEKQTKEDKADYNAPFELSAWKAIESNYKAILPKIAELENEQNKWISVSDKLPKEIERVQTIDRSDCYRKLHLCDGEWLDDNGDEYFGITHWMPLPPKPTTNK